MKITMIKKEMELKKGTKTVYQEIETTLHKITMEQYKNVVNARKFFSFFGKEYHIKNYTKAGYIVDRILHTTKDKKIKIEMKFLFE